MVGTAPANEAALRQGTLSMDMLSAAMSLNHIHVLKMNSTLIPTPAVR